MSDDNPDWQKDIPLVARQKREMFARFGLASYHGQCLERQLGILLATMHNPEFLQTQPDDREDIFESNFKKTLGQLVSILQQRTDLQHDFESRLIRGVEIRNWLAHDYFWQHAGDILSYDGCERMIRELMDAATFLHTLDNELTTVSEMWAISIGVSKATLEEEYDKFRRAHRA